MNLTWHLVRKDLRLLCLPLALWSGLFLVRIAICERLLLQSGDASEVFNKLSTQAMTITFVIGLVNFSLAAMLVLEDAPVGSRLFWVTRPISGGRLLAAKGLAAVIAFVLLPIAIHLAWGLLAGVPLAELGHSVLRTAIFQSLVTLPCFLVAALTGQASRLLIWSLIVLVGVPVLLMTVQYSIGKPDLSPGVLATRETLLVGWLALGALGAIVVQFLTRRTARSVAIVVATMGLAVVGLFAWRWDWTPPARQMGAADETFEVRPDRVWTRARGSHIELTIALARRAGASGMTSRGGRVRAEFTWSDGSSTQVDGFLRFSGWARETLLAAERAGIRPVPVADPETERHLQETAEERKREAQLRAQKQGRPFGDQLDARETDLVVLTLPSEVGKRVLREQPRCTLTVEVRTMEPEFLGELPLRRGAELRAHGYRLVVQEAEHKVRHLPETEFQVLNMRVVFSGPAGPFGEVVYVSALDRQRAPAFFATESGSIDPLPRALGLPLGFGTVWQTIPAPRVWRTDRWIEQPEEFATFRAAAVVFRPREKLSQVLTIERVKPMELPAPESP